MTAPKRLTRRLFWSHWPEVATGFVIDPYNCMRDANEHCPITAVAARVGFPVESSVSVDRVLPSKWPAWAEDVVAAADGSDHRPTYRRLVEHIPEGNR